MSELTDELRRIAAWIRTPGNIMADDAIDECARVLENRARELEKPTAWGYTRFPGEKVPNGYGNCRVRNGRCIICGERK